MGYLFDFCYYYHVLIQKTAILVWHHRESVFYVHWNSPHGVGYVEFDTLSGPWRDALMALPVAHA